MKKFIFLSLFILSACGKISVPEKVTVIPPANCASDKDSFIAKFGVPDKVESNSPDNETFIFNKDNLKVSFVSGGMWCQVMFSQLDEDEDVFNLELISG